MVLLTMTPSMVDALEKLRAPATDDDADCDHAARDQDEATAPGADDGEPLLARPVAGKPISHGQIVDLWKRLQASQHSQYSLERLLRGSRVYVPPPPPRPEPSDEYKALMARLRRQEAEDAYERMVSPPRRVEAFGDGFPTAAHAFARVNRPSSATDLGDDDVTYSEAHRQVMLIVNFLVSILGVAGTLWVAARWWSLPARLLLTMAGSIVVAVAEVAVYQGYVWRMGQAKSKQKAVREVKEVVQTWVVGQDAEGNDDDGTAVPVKVVGRDRDGLVRKRRTATTEQKAR